MTSMASEAPSMRDTRSYFAESIELMWKESSKRRASAVVEGITAVPLSEAVVAIGTSMMLKL